MLVCSVLESGTMSDALAGHLFFCLLLALFVWSNID